MKTEGGPAGRSKTLFAWLAAVTALIGAWLFFCCDPASSPYLPGCLFYRLTGLYCAGCGSIRACHELIHFHPLAALRYNPMLFAGGALLLSMLWTELAGKKQVHRYLVWGFLVILFLFWILRNIPAYPFTILAPSA